MKDLLNYRGGGEIKYEFRSIVVEDRFLRFSKNGHFIIPTVYMKKTVKNAILGRYTRKIHEKYQDFLKNPCW